MPVSVCLFFWLLAGSGPPFNPVKSYEEGLMLPGCMCVCLPTVHFGRERISQSPPAAVELVEIVPHSFVIQLRKSDQSEVGFNLHKEQGT